MTVGNQLGELLRAVEGDAAKLVIPRARKWAGLESLPRWEELLRDESMLLELRAIGTSIANTMRPLAGNTFSAWVSELLSKSFESRNLPMQSFTKGRVKARLSKKFVIREGEQRIDLRPDIDIVVAYQSPNRQAVPLAIISAKTTLAERVMQTINWTRYKTDERLPEEVRSIKLYLVTAWETFAESDVNRERVQELDGVYVCNTKFQRYGNIKPFEEMLDDLKSLLPDEAISSS